MLDLFEGLKPQPRFLAIWLALAVLLAVSAIFVPRSLMATSILAIIPFAAFLCIASMGEALVLMARGIDLSIPAVITLSSSMILGVSGGEDAALGQAIAAALAVSAGIGLVNGVLVSNFRLNPLVVTLAIGTIAMGAAIWYREGIAQEARVPPSLADWGETRFLSINLSVWVAMALVLAATVLLRLTVYGRRFIAVGTNPTAAWIAGIGVNRYRIAAYVAAGLLYGIVGILLSAFIRNPTLDVGAAYLLAPIAAAVLGGTAIGGGMGNMIAVAGAALFLTHLGQILKMMGLSTAIQFMVYGGAIAIGMALAGIRFSAVRDAWMGLRRRVGTPAAHTP